jgi:hypothetical protein
MTSTKLILILLYSGLDITSKFYMLHEISQAKITTLLLIVHCTLPRKGNQPEDGS